MAVRGDDMQRGIESGLPVAAVWASVSGARLAVKESSDLEPEGFLRNGENKVIVGKWGHKVGGGAGGRWWCVVSNKTNIKRCENQKLHFY